MPAPAPHREIDGVHFLARREQTRLWYRLSQDDGQIVSPVDVVAQERLASAVRVIRTERPIGPGTDRLIREVVQPSRALADLQQMLDAPETAPVIADDSGSAAALTDWRTTPTRSPVLLLSASAILDARNPGPILGPGTRYRIMDVTNGVVSLQIAKLDNQVSAGFCNIGDFMSVDPEIAYYRRTRQTGRLGTARLGLNKISQRLSGVTASTAG